MAYFCVFFYIMFSPIAVFVENEGFQVNWNILHIVFITCLFVLQNFIDYCKAQIVLPKIAAEGMKEKAKIQVNKFHWVKEQPKKKSK